MLSRFSRSTPMARLLFSLLAIIFACSCGRPPYDTSPSSGESQTLPFDRKPGTIGISPSRSWLPSNSKIPEGTTIVVRLLSQLSSASSHAGDTFNAALDEPVVIDGQTLLASGTPLTGRVLEAKISGSSIEPGYLRIVLVAANVGSRLVMIETSSIFAKGGPREEPSAPSGSSASHEDIVFDAGRRLNFRLAQTVDLQKVDLQK
jgi:hypothetical protein